MPEPVSPPASVARRWYHPLALLQRLVIYALVAYFVICMYLLSFQNSLIYPRKATGADLPLDQAVKVAKMVGLVPWGQTVPGADAPQGYVKADFSSPAPRGTIIVFHGNGDWAWARTEYVQAFTKRGFRTFLYEYPGYGGRPGRPSEATIVPDARALIRSLDQAGYGPIYVWGKSLGSGVSAAVCADSTLPVHGLVLLTPWDTIANVGQSFYPYIPVRLLMVDKYDSIANLTRFQHPICVVRSSNDEIIPPRLTLNLFAHLPDPKKIILHDGYGHNDWPNAAELPWWDEALDFIAPRN